MTWLDGANVKWLQGLIFVPVVMVWFAGCAATQQTRDVKKSGFLRDHYYLLQEGEKGEARLVYKNPQADWASYDKVIIDPVMIWKDARTQDVSRADLQRLANDLWSKIREALGKDYEIAHQPGPGVMRVTVAITEAEASNPAMDTISSVVPQLRLLTGAKGLVAGGKPGFVGAASIEGKITDAKTRTLLMAGVDRRAGTKSLRGSTNSWNDVEEAYQYWTDKLRYRLCTLRGGTNCMEPKA